MPKLKHPLAPNPAGEPMTTLATRIPKSLHRQLRVYCLERGITVQQAVEATIRERLAGRRKPRDAVSATDNPHGPDKVSDAPRPRVVSGLSVK